MHFFQFQISLAGRFSKYNMNDTLLYLTSIEHNLDIGQNVYFHEKDLRTWSC